MKNYNYFQYIWLIIFTLSIFGLLLAFSQANLESVEKILLAISIKQDLVDTEKLHLILSDDSATKEINQLIINSDFSLGLENWNDTGHVEIISNDIENYIQLGNEDSTNLINENCISQEITLLDNYEFLGIKFKQFSDEELTGFDSIAWAVLLNDNIVHLEANNETAVADWQWKIIKLENYETGINQVKICAGNTGDREYSSWVQLDQVTTKVVSINPSQVLNISSDNNHRVSVAYFLDGNQVELGLENQHQLDFPNKIDKNELLVKIYQDQNIVDQEIIPVFVSETEPEIIHNLKVYNLENNEDNVDYFLLNYPNSFSSSSIFQNLSNYFEVRYSNEQFMATDWDSLFKADQVYLTDDLSLLQPICFYDECWLAVKTSTSVSADFFSIKSCDITGKCSIMSEFVQAEPFILEFLLTPTPTANLSNIIINEISYNPLGDDRGDWLNGEWVELNNKGDQEIDLNNWFIEDEAGWKIQLSAENCDINSNVTDVGETVIPGKGYLLVFTRGRAIFNNSSDSVYLFTQENELIDQVTYIGSGNENVSCGRVPDGYGSWLDSLPFTPLQPNFISD